MFEIRACKSDEEKEIAFKIREDVFVYEQGFSLEIERDEYDGSALHIVGYEDNIPVCCARLMSVDGNKQKLGRIAVLKNKRGCGYGQEMCKFLVSCAKMKFPSEIYLESQLQAKNFYAKCGFVAVGSVFLEEEVEHIKMIYPS